MRKGVAAGLLAAAVVLGAVIRPGVAAATGGSGSGIPLVSVAVDGAVLELDPPARVVNGRALAPARGLAAALGAEAVWDGPARAVTLRRGPWSVGMTIGSPEALVNGQVQVLDVAPALAAGQALVPVRAVAEGLGAAVAWDGATRTVRIATAPVAWGPGPEFSLFDLLRLFPAGYGIDFATGRFTAPDGSLLDQAASDRIWATLLERRTGKALLLVAATISPATGFNPLAQITAPPTRTAHAIPGRAGLEADLYRPAGPGPHPALVLYSPLAEAGREDPDLIHIADTLARLGFAVTVPMRGVTTLVSPADADDVAAAAGFLLAQPAVDAGRLSFLCVSYGIGPCMGAAARPEWRNRVQTIVSMGGYAYMENMLAMAVTGRHPGAAGFAPDPYVQEVLRRSIATQPEDLQAHLEALSPALTLRGWPGRLLIIHSTNDPFIPHVESQLLFAAAPEGQARLAVVSIFEHARVREIDWSQLLADYANDLFNLLGLSMEIVP